MKQPDDRPGYYYVIWTSNSHTALLAGPFPSHTQALSLVKQARKIVQEIDPWAVSYTFGTCRTERNRGGGFLNDKLGVTT